MQGPLSRSRSRGKLARAFALSLTSFLVLRLRLCDFVFSLPYLAFFLFLCVCAFVYSDFRVLLPSCPLPLLIAMAATVSGYIDEHNCCAMDL